ncbi:hypothetical protein THAOC_12116, partial [Thalassiosira oceanica]
IVSFEVGKARLSGGRRRPPAAWHEGRGNADTIPWRRFQSGPVIIAKRAKWCLGEECFVCMVASDREWRGQEKKAPAFRSGSPKSLRAPRAVVTRFLAHARFQTAPTSLLTLQTCGGGLRLGHVKMMNSRTGTAACIGRAGPL